MSTAISSSRGVSGVLRAPHVPRVLIASQVGRLPLASAPLALLLYARESLTITAAGLLVAAYTAGMAVGAPLLARTVDRWRQPPVLWGSAALSGLGLLLVVAAGHTMAGAAVGAAVAGLGTPPLEACLRALWPDLLPAELVQVGYALDIALQEVIFVVGPLTTLGAVALGGPSAGLVAAAGLQLAGTGVFALSRPVRAWRGVPAPRHWAGPLRAGRLVLLLLGVAGGGAGFGSLPVALAAYSEWVGDRSLTGWLLAAEAVGGLVAGLLWTRVRPGGPARLPVLAGLLAVGFLPLLLTPGPVPMVGLLAVCGVTLPPLLTTVFVTADRLAPTGTVAEAFAWVVTAFTLGSAAGAALTGALVPLGVRYGFALPPVAAGLGAVLMVLVVRPSRPGARERLSPGAPAVSSSRGRSE
ncbi:MFS transporter [Plantactinospora siamensis]|uniref:MFS transporter n=1 Tax=Plantactinospora siamensis TaxID=555372 RepID=A0ABV6NXW6_9ACTN